MKNYRFLLTAFPLGTKQSLAVILSIVDLKSTLKMIIGTGIHLCCVGFTIPVSVVKVF